MPIKGVFVVSYNLQGILAQVTGDTRSKAWHEIEGPDSGCGVDYWYTHWRYKDVYINIDQGHMKISVCDTDEVLYEGDPSKDAELKKFVTTS